MSEPDEIAETDVAIVGMSGRFPGAPDPDALWRRVVAGDDCLIDLGRDEILAEGVPARIVDDPSYVRRTGVLDDVGRFDADLFGIAPRDAAIMDPQHRHFMECAWAALESAAIDPTRFDGSIGVFAGSGMNTYLLHNLLANPRLVDDVGWFLLRHTGNDKDFLTTEVSYRLDLRGPSVNVQTACSTSLVAVHLAVQSLLGFECDAALAGGVTIEVPQRTGHLHQEGEILSADGYCRAFDARSTGTVLTSGVGVVVLRRLGDALADGDPILAVVKGSAMNNDGARKVSYLAPSVDGHADVVREALAVADLSPGDIQLLEAHGTGTALGDPIEFSALSAAFDGSPAGGCRLASTKPNVGHLDTAAGVVSLIKVVQSLRHATLPPMANHTAPSELIALDGSPFTLSGCAEPWPDRDVRRAGISSLGVGGTNAHVIVEEAPERTRGDEPSDGADGPFVLALSAASDDSLRANATALADAIADDPDLRLADVAHTLATGRRRLARRSVVVASGRDDAVDQLRSLRAPRTPVGEVAPRIVFAFPGGGSQYPGMGAGLDRGFEAFTRVRDEVAEVVRDAGGADLSSIWGPEVDPAILDRPTIALPATFATSLAMAAQWREWGVEPDVLLGHSLGEYVAAHLAGVMSLADAVTLVVSRAGLMEAVGGDSAAMLVVPLSEDAVAGRLGPEVSLAVVNGDDEVVLSGAADAIAVAAAEWRREGIETTPVRLAAAAHSHLLDPVLDEFRSVARSVDLRAPARPYVTNLTGTWITDDAATDPEHWVAHLRGTVRFSECIETVASGAPYVVVEIGPGHTLSATARRARSAPHAAIASMRHPRHDARDDVAALAALGQAWSAGVPVDLTRVGHPSARRITLPTYAFGGEHHWIDRPAGAVDDVDEHRTPARLTDVRSMWWERRWEATPAPPEESPRRWIVVGDEGDRRRDELASTLRARGQVSECTRLGDELPGDLDDRTAVVLMASDPVPVDVGEATGRWLESAGRLARALGGAATREHRLVVLTVGAYAVSGAASPLDAMARGVALVAPHEYEGLAAQHLDVAQWDPEAIASELVTMPDDPVVALVAGDRLRPRLAPVAGDALPGGDGPTPKTVLVTGGLGGVGSTLAADLARRGSSVVVVTTTELPEPADRETWRAAHGPRDRTTQRLDRLEHLESFGGEVHVLVGDVAAPADVDLIVATAVELLGSIDLVVHAAGELRDAPIELWERADLDAVVGAKVGGALALVDAARRHGVASIVNISSTSSEIAAGGQGAYVAASAVLDELAGSDDEVVVRTLGSGMWSGVGMAEDFALRSRLGLARGEAVAHPVFEEIVGSLDAGRCDVVGHLDARRHWQVSDHRNHAGDPVLPGTGHLWLLVDALRLARGADRDADVALEDVTLHEPLVVQPDRAVLVRVRIERDGDVIRAHIDSDDGSSSWRRHSSASVVGPPDPSPPVQPRTAAGPVVDAFAGQRDHLRLGTRWDARVEAVVDVDRAVGTITAIDPVGEAGAALDVALLDAGTGLAVQLLRRRATPEALWVPIGYQRVECSGSVGGVADVSVRRQEGDGALFDLQFSSVDGSTVHIGGLELWAVDPARLDDSPSPADESADSIGPEANDGIRPEEGGPILDLFLCDDRPRLLVSTVDLPSLVEAAQRPDPALARPDESIGSVDGTTREVVAGAWSSLLGVGDVVDDDDFFELGGHSLIAIRLLAQLKRAFHVEIQLAELIAASTLAAMVDLVDARREGTGLPGELSTLVEFGRSEASGLPLHIVHGAGGGVLFLHPLARALDGERRVVGIQARGIDGRDEPDDRIDQMADRYVEVLRAAQPGPYVLAGYSGGGLVALEMAERLRDAGDEVRGVILIDSVPPGCAEPRRRVRVRNVARHLAAGRLRGVSPYLRDMAGRGFRRRPLVAPDVEEDHVNLFDHFSTVAERHPLSRYRGRVDLLKADQVWPIQPWDYYWGPYIDDLRITSVPGDHFSMFDAPNIDHLAAEVRRILDEVDP